MIDEETAQSADAQSMQKNQVVLELTEEIWRVRAYLVPCSAMRAFRSRTS